MSTFETVKRYHLIIGLLKRRPCTFEEIKQSLEREGEFRGIHFNFSIRTFKRDREDIASIYGFDIDYNKSMKAYKIKDIQIESDIMVMEAFDVIDAFSVKSNTSNYVFFDERRSSGTENLFGILHAIRNNLNISFWYHRFQEAKGDLKEVSPYALKEFKKRWYILALETSTGKIKLFALDRLIDLSILPTRFNKNNMPDIKEMFNGCFGIFLPESNQKLEHVVLSFSAFKGKYIESLKLHPSQQVIVSNENEYSISLDIYITYDFIMELLSHSLDVKVIEPIHLQKTLIEHHKGAINQYS